MYFLFPHLILSFNYFFFLNTKMRLLSLTSKKKEAVGRIIQELNYELCKICLLHFTKP